MKLTWIENPFYENKIYILKTNYYALQDLLIYTRNKKSGMVYKTTPNFTGRTVFKKYIL